MGYMLEEGPQKATVDHITLDVEGTAVPAYHARPDGEALGGVVLSPDLAGLRPLIEDHCRRLAPPALAVCAPATFARLIPAGGSPGVEGRRTRTGPSTGPTTPPTPGTAASPSCSIDTPGGTGVSPAMICPFIDER